MGPTRKAIRIIVFALDLVFRIVGTYVIAVIGGNYLDGKLGTGKAILLVFLFLASINVLYTLVTINKKYGK
ncbi:MAG: hypothetical protein PHI41_04035 [Erysipelotrichaceae bacterium]|nr:hypothetical protein [Erysipelotrichaceae bacterium]MDD3809046.1 hypothetical protein [Erysipelotrichaceae bacterium]